MQAKIQKYRPLHDNMTHIDAMRYALTKIELCSIPEESDKNKIDYQINPNEILGPICDILSIAGAMYANYQAEAGRS